MAKIVSQLSSFSLVSYSRVIHDSHRRAPHRVTYRHYADGNLQSRVINLRRQPSTLPPLPLMSVLEISPNTLHYIPRFLPPAGERGTGLMSRAILCSRIRTARNQPAYRRYAKIASSPSMSQRGVQREERTSDGRSFTEYQFHHGGWCSRIPACASRTAT